MDNFIADNKLKEFAIKNKNGYEIIVNKNLQKIVLFGGIKLYTIILNFIMIKKNIMKSIV